MTDEAGATVLYSMEEPVVGEWARWTDNAGEFADPSAPELLRFSEWTHSYSGGYVMVADLQGARHAGGWRLADPAVLCSDVGRFGPCGFDAAQVPRCLAAVRHALQAGEAADPGGQHLSTLIGMELGDRYQPPVGGFGLDPRELYSSMLERERMDADECR